MLVFLDHIKSLQEMINLLADCYIVKNLWHLKVFSCHFIRDADTYNKNTGWSMEEITQTFSYLISSFISYQCMFEVNRWFYWEPIKCCLFISVMWNGQWLDTIWQLILCFCIINSVNIVHNYLTCIYWHCTRLVTQSKPAQHINQNMTETWLFYN